MKITYDNIVKDLINNFPEFTEYDEENLDIPHVIIGNFATLLRERIENNPNESFVKKAIDFINEIYTGEDLKLMDLIQVELFENLAQSEKAILFSRNNLSYKAREFFEKAMGGFGIESLRR